jgi:IPT/TIG domain
MRKIILFLIGAMLLYAANAHKKNGLGSFSANMVAPTISSFSPAVGPPGTLVTITGTNLTAPTAFTIGGVAAIAISNNGSTLVGLVMLGAVTGTVSVTTAGGTATSVSSFSIIPTPFPSGQQGNKLVGTGSVGQALQGWSVAISADGNTAIEGGDQDNGFAGAAWVYTRTGGIWTQQGNKLVGSDSAGIAGQGSGVAISADGNTAIVGGTGDSSLIGAAWVYTRSGGVWMQQGIKLVGIGGIVPDFQGNSVSLSADGNTAIVGGNRDNSYVGAAWVFTRSGGVWAQQGGKLIGTGGVGQSEQGSCVSISADGNTAIVGGPGDNSNIGAVWIYTRSGGVWTQQGSKLIGTGGVGAGFQGKSVAISADGNTAAVGGYDDNSGVGAAWVYTRSSGLWTQQGSKLTGTGGSGVTRQGISASISADGNIVMVGGNYDSTNNIGAVWVFTRSGGAWKQQGSKLVGIGGVGSPQYQGGSVSISADGSTAIEGGDADNGFVGASWVFIQTVNITWTGGISSDWMTGGNWSGGAVPGLDANVIIPAGTPFSPIVFAGTNTKCRDVFVSTGAKVTVQHGGTLNTVH